MGPTSDPQSHTVTCTCHMSHVHVLAFRIRVTNLRQHKKSFRAGSNQGDMRLSYSSIPLLKLSHHDVPLPRPGRHERVRQLAQRTSRPCAVLHGEEQNVAGTSKRICSLPSSTLCAPQRECPALPSAAAFRCAAFRHDAPWRLIRAGSSTPGCDCCTAIGRCRAWRIGHRRAWGIWVA